MVCAVWGMLCGVWGMFFLGLRGVVCGVVCGLRSMGLWSELRGVECVGCGDGVRCGVCLCIVCGVVRGVLGGR